MPKLGRGLGVSNLPNRYLEYFFPSGPVGGVYTEPSEIGAAVSIVEQSPFGGGAFSYNFTSSVDSYLKLNYDPSWSVGTDDFTIEWFSYQTSQANSVWQRVFTIDDYPNMDIGASIELFGDFYYWANNSAIYNSAGASTTNTWYHFAIVRRSGKTRVYRNGIQLGAEITDTNNITNPANLPLYIGNSATRQTSAAFRGYITNFRWVKGLAVYTGNFTVPTDSLSLVAGANPFGGSNTQAIPAGYTKLLLVPGETYFIVTDADQALITNNNDFIIYGT